MKQYVLAGTVVLLALTGCSSDDPESTPTMPMTSIPMTSSPSSSPSPSPSTSAFPSPTNTGAAYLAELHAQFGNEIGSDEKLLQVADDVCKDLGVSGATVADVVDYYTSPPTPVDKNLTVGVIVAAVKYYCPGYQSQVDDYLEGNKGVA